MSICATITMLTKRNVKIAAYRIEFTLQMGHCEKPKVILGPVHPFCKTSLQQWWWNTWPQSNCIAGAHDNASTKQIMHMSSASCVNFGPGNGSPSLHIVCKHGKHFVSLITPPHGWPHCLLLVHVLAACTWHSALAQTFPIANSPELPVTPQKRHRPIELDGPEIIALLPSLNSTIAFNVFESASASSQNNFVRPQLSCNSTRIASSSSLHNVRWWVRAFRFKCRNLSQSPHNEPHTSHWITAGVMPSSWFEQCGRVSDDLDHWPDDSLRKVVNISQR